MYGFNNVYNLLSPGSEITLRKMIMDIKVEDGEIFHAIIRISWNFWKNINSRNMQIQQQVT